MAKKSPNWKTIETKRKMEFQLLNVQVFVFDFTFYMCTWNTVTCFPTSWNWKNLTNTVHLGLSILILSPLWLLIRSKTIDPFSRLNVVLNETADCTIFKLQEPFCSLLQYWNCFRKVPAKTVNNFVVEKGQSLNKFRGRKKQREFIMPEFLHCRGGKYVILSLYPRYSFNDHFLVKIKRRERWSLNPGLGGNV